MPTIEDSRTLVKSPPELWADLKGGRLAEAVGHGSVRPAEPERSLDWEAGGARGSATLEPAGWGTKVTLTAEVEEAVAQGGLWRRLPWQAAEPPRREELERRLTELLDDLGTAHRKPFGRQ